MQLHANSREVGLLLYHSMGVLPCRTSGTPVSFHQVEEWLDQRPLPPPSLDLFPEEAGNRSPFHDYDLAEHGLYPALHRVVMVILYHKLRST